MARRDKGLHRVWGPYRDGARGWRVVTAEPGRAGRRSVETFADEAEARDYAARARRAAPNEVMMETALDAYEKHLAGKGNRAGSIATTMTRVRTWCQGVDLVRQLTPRRLGATYEARAQKISTDTHRNELAEVKTFCRWVVAQGWLRASPSEAIQPTGRRRRGKPQLRAGEAQRLSRLALELAQTGDEGALAVLAFLWLGCRAGELLERRCRDVDGSLLWIEDAKTDAGERRLELPAELAELLAAQVAGRPGEAWLWPSSRAGTGHRERTWARRQARRVARLAGVPYVPPHGLRGTNSTLAEEAGTAPLVVARSLGHASTDVTAAHYTAPGVREQQSRRRAMKVIQGGGR